LNDALVGLIGREIIRHTHGTADVHGIGRGERIDTQITGDKHGAADVERIIGGRFSHRDVAQYDGIVDRFARSIDVT
jgi:hypothetical protein